MSQEQTVQPIVLKQENGELVLKVVLENPQQKTQTLVLQQPKGEEFTFSTDTTAIWSFVIAMIVAFILGVSATIIAIWYGRRSFKLTEMGFEVTKKQIQSSEKSIFEHNRMLILFQEELKVKELKILSRNNNLNKVRELIADNFNLAGSLQNQVEIAIEEKRWIRKFEQLL